MGPKETAIWAGASVYIGHMSSFSYFSEKTGSDISCKFSPKECMRCQILLSRKNKKNTSKCHLLKFLPSMQSVPISLVRSTDFAIFRVILVYALMLNTTCPILANSVDSEEAN